MSSDLRRQVPLLMIPGPTNLHPRVLEALSLPMVGHGSPQFYSEFLDILELTKYLFRTKNPVVFSGSGTSGMESTSASLLERSDRVLSVENGFFGRRSTMIARIYCDNVEPLVVPEGSSVTPDALDAKLSSGSYQAVLITHVETSTGALNPVRDLAAVVRKHEALSIVDTVCGTGGSEFMADDWGVDAAFVGSQKCIAAPPGAVLIALSDRALKKIAERKTPVASYYYDLTRWLKVMADPHMYLATPSVSVLRALRVALMMVKEEGLEARWRRHADLASALRDGLRASGVGVMAEMPANTVTAVKVRDAGWVVKQMLEKHNIMVSMGLESHRQDTVRVGHMGIVSKDAMLKTLGAMLSCMKERGDNVDGGVALEPLLRLPA